MGCFLGCLGGAKDQKRRRQRTNRGGSPRVQRNRVQNVQQEGVTSGEPTIAETPQTNLVSELQSKPTGEVQLSPSPRKRVTFNSNVTTYEHVSVQESIDYENVGREKKDDLKRISPSHSLSEDGSSVITTAVSYPPNHRYHNARESDDEGDEYGDSDLDDFDYSDDEDDYDDEHSDDMISGQQVWDESVLTTSMESRTEHHPILEKVDAFGTKDNGRDRNGYINSVLNPIENITQWKAAKSKATLQLKPQDNFAAVFKSKFDEQKKENQEIAVDASFSWLVSPEIMLKKTSFSDDTLLSSSGKTFPEGSSTPLRSFQDRAILVALTVEELRQNSPRKSPSRRSPDEMPIVGSGVGTHWNHSASTMLSNSAHFYKRGEVFMK